MPYLVNGIGEKEVNNIIEIEKRGMKEKDER